MEENTTLEILKQAILLERRGKAFYQKVAEQTENKAIRDVFATMAEEEQKAWVVDLKKDHHELRTFLENGDDELCMGGKQCVSLGIEIAQLRDNIKLL